MSVTAMFTSQKRVNNTTPPTDGWINKCWHIHAREYYSAMRRNGYLRHAAAWMNLENMKHGRTQNHKKATCSMIQFL